jgi:hypothetical protein
MKVGDRVKIVDHSMAHGDIATIDTIQKDGIILVEFDADEEKGIAQGTCWFVELENELELI